jgi:hypothetical protein
MLPLYTLVSSYSFLPLGKVHNRYCWLVVGRTCKIIIISRGLLVRLRFCAIFTVNVSGWGLDTPVLVPSTTILHTFLDCLNAANGSNNLLCKVDSYLLIKNNHAHINKFLWKLLWGPKLLYLYILASSSNLLFMFSYRQAGPKEWP